MVLNLLYAVPQERFGAIVKADKIIAYTNG